jgi:hypothetical protein
MFLYLPFVANTSESVFIGYADAVGNAWRLTFDARILCLCILHTENQTFNSTLVETNFFFQKGNTLQRRNLGRHGETHNQFACVVGDKVASHFQFENGGVIERRERTLFKVDNVVDSERYVETRSFDAESTSTRWPEFTFAANRKIVYPSTVEM